MNITVASRSQVRRRFLEEISQYFVRELNLESSTYSVEIRSVNGLLKQSGFYGSVIETAPKQLLMFVDSRINLQTLTSTLAHEWVHVKQFARGQLKTRRNRRGRTVKLWFGREHKPDPFTSPWEQEAYKRETVMTMNLIGKIIGNLTK